jgi:hypothetical protein
MDKTLDLDELERVAKRATQARRYRVGPKVYARGHGVPLLTVNDLGPSLGQQDEDATYIATFDPPTILTLIAAARPAVVSDEVVEVTDRKSQWMLENSEGRWLHNAEDGTFTSDPNLGLKWPNRTAADAFRLSLRGPFWALKLTEHVWIEPESYDWTDAEDDIADAISDSMDMDWSSRDGARAVVAYLKQIGAKLP